jgi:serine/threonine protein phosphatase PrpC
MAEVMKAAGASSDAARDAVGGETAAPTAPGAVSREWRMIGETVCGASHRRAGTPNQDAILLVRESSVGLPLILSVSDGHGSDKCFRSHRGSRFAVAVGAELMCEFFSDRGDAEVPLPDGKIGGALSAEFARRWNAAVDADLAREPLKAEELDRLEAKDGARARKMVEANRRLAYGATTLTVGLTDSFAVYLQLGDGEIVTVSETGEVSRPLAEDERLLANETTSLCADTAARDFRFACLPLTDPPPALILVTTDGYANSFADDAGFLKVGSDLLAMLRADGFDAVNRSVRGWLEEATRIGSGDDCTLGVICRMDALTQPPPGESATTQAGAPPDALRTAVEAAPDGNSEQQPEPTQ